MFRSSCSFRIEVVVEETTESSDKASIDSASATAGASLLNVSPRRRRTRYTW
jgi:hypothetical protein